MQVRRRRGNHQQFAQETGLVAPSILYSLTQKNLYLKNPCEVSEYWSQLAVSTPTYTEQQCRR